ncbi:MAG TPA: alpha-E domain-containing protein, partial [Opitutales bacterium]|nr:alpha-E domain-containing protein [Opitutales bacterium]
RFVLADPVCHESDREYLLGEFLKDKTDSVFVQVSEPVADLLLIDPTNPRSVAFQTHRIVEHVASLPIADTEEPQTRRRRLARSIDSEIELADIRALLAADEHGSFPQFTGLLARLSENLLALSDQLALHYFSHSDKKTLFSRFY